MIQFFRSFFQSKLGIAVTLGFLGIIGFAFAASDMSGNLSGSVSGDDRVAVVGNEKISTSNLISAANSSLKNAREENPTLSMPSFLAQGGFEDVLDQLLERASIAEFAKKYGLRAGKNLVNSQIIMIPAFRGADGNFSQESYDGFLKQNGLTDKLIRGDIGSGLLAQQVLVPAAFGGRVPDKMAAHYASLLKERRQGSIVIVPANLFAPKSDPTAGQLSAFYQKTKDNYIRPERRVIRYFTFGAKQLGAPSAPTNQEIAARFKQNSAQYAASESRELTQLIVPTRQAAESIRDQVQKGGSLEAAAAQAGLQTSKVGPIASAEYASQSSTAVAAAVFGTNQGAIAAPAQSGLGFHVVRVDKIDKKAGRNLAQATPEIITALTEEKRRQALSDLAQKVEDQVDDGIATIEIAKELGVEVSSTKPVTGAGIVYGTLQDRVPDLIAPALKTAFQMEEGEPQLAVAQGNEEFLVFEVTDIEPSVAAPMKDIREQLIAAWKQAEGSKLAKTAADRIMKRINEGADVATALRGENKVFPKADTINLTREQLATSGQRVPAPLALMFSMAQGTTKKLAAPNNAGWFLVRLDKIEPGKIAKDDPLFLRAKSELSQTVGREYSDQLRKAIETEMGAERNETAIAAVRKQLAGGN
ncbi:MAG: peptidyl-prolyl cis-trans isomerase [Pontixanthobacter sp.]